MAAAVDSCVSLPLRKAVGRNVDLFPSVFNLFFCKVALLGWKRSQEYF